MKTNKTNVLGLTICASLIATGAAFAQPVIDGSGATTEYGSALYVNTLDPTAFGDNNLVDVDWANGSEIDGVYGFVQDGVLYLHVSGNLESNYNKLELFFDSVDGGQNKLRGDNPDVDFNGLNRMGDDGSGNGLQFNDGFDADRYVVMAGGDNGGSYAIFANWAEILTDGGGTGRYLGQGGAVTDGTLAGGDNPDGIMITINNSNVAGVTDSTSTDADLVDTGMEIAIPLSALGNPSGDIKICAFVNGGGHDFVSNQVSGGLEGFGNLGEPRDVDFDNVEGTQYVVVPNAGPGDCLTMVTSAFVAGQQASWDVSNATPGEEVAIAYGFQPGNTNVSNLFNYCAAFEIKGVNTSKVICRKNADGAGEVKCTKNLPAGAAGRRLLSQAAERNTCPDPCMSNLDDQVIQ